MSLACFRRPARAGDELPKGLRVSLAVAVEDLDLSRTRRVAATAGVTCWAIPTRDSRGIIHVTEEPGGGGSLRATTLDALDEYGISALIGIRRGRWRYAMVIADGYDRVRAGGAEAPVTDNFAVLELPDRARHIELSGPAGTRTVDLGPSDWDRFMETGPGLPDPAG